MTIASMCTGDQVVIQTETNTSGSSWGNTPTFSDAAAATDCLVQTPSASELQKYEARGMALTHWVFFSSDQSLTNKNRLKWTVKSGTSLSSSRFLRVLDYYSEGRPGEDLLWVADCSEETTRRET